MALLRPCTTSAGFLATPERTRRVDMARLREALQRAGFHILVDARIILVVRPPGPAASATESSLYDTGKVLLKTTERERAEAAYQALRPHLESAWT